LRPIAPILATLLAVTAGSPGCIAQRCLRDADCADDTVCRKSEGVCTEPECETSADCGGGRICEGHFCLAGCETNADCAPTERCVDQRCRLVSGDCDCPLAPTACGADLNPRSATAEAEVCVPRDFPDGTGIFFGSIYCGHCTANLAALWERKLELEAEGLHPNLMWIQLGRVAATPEAILTQLDAAWDFPVIQDDEPGSLWESYNADWYHFVIVDSHGCTDASRHFGPLSAAGVAGEEGELILDAWRTALSDECTLGTE
jgi:hypothetical protein